MKEGTPFLDLARLQKTKHRGEPRLCLVCANFIREGDNCFSLLPRTFCGQDVIAHGVCVRAVQLALIEVGRSDLIPMSTFDVVKEKP